MLAATALGAFTKVEGLGNDFILLDRRARDADALASEIAELRGLAPTLCDRRLGIGGDGVLVVGPGAAGSAASMIVVNFDGSRPEMCGNGLRCVAAFVAGGRACTITIATDAGLKRCVVEGEIVEVDMGPAIALGRRTPLTGEGREFVGVSMGNPHAIEFVNDPAESPESLARRLGPAIELDPVYAPSKTNVEFARLLDDGAIELWVWERGVGITQACGTGACATAAAAAWAGLVSHDVPVEVRLPGGSLQITVPSYPNAGVLMRGPGRRVFSGQLER
jgi:diaminopimelate epimerase